MLTRITKLHITSRFYSANETQIHNLTLYFIVRYSTALIPSCPKGVTMIANRPKAVFFIRPSKFENSRPKDGWTVGWLRPCLSPCQTKMRVDESCNTRSCLSANSHRLSCTIIDLELVQMLMRVDDRFGYSRAVISTQLLSTLMQFLFLFDRGTRVEKTLMQILASQLSYTSWSLLTGA
jgi:hypothetical protein